MFILSGKRLHKYYGEDLLRVKALAKKHDPKEKLMNNFIRKYFDQNDEDLTHVPDENWKNAKL